MSYMTRRERIAATLQNRTPDRIPRTYAAVPGFCHNHPGALEHIEKRFPQDTGDCGYRLPDGAVRGDPYAVGTYVDEWGCAFENVHPGVIGQGMENVDRTCDAADGFTSSAVPLQPFERMQFLRGTQSLLLDLIEQPAGWFKLRDMVHEFNLACLDSWCRTAIDCVVLADDWGSQRSLLISPDLWRELFKPLYADYIAGARGAGKFTYMHSDGYITDILDDLIEIGLDAVNAQVTCMDMAELARRFAGRITFWGQMDRQHMLCFQEPADARQAARDFQKHLAAPNGSRTVAQMYIEPTAKPENIEAVLDEFERLELPASP